LKFLTYVLIAVGWGGAAFAQAPSVAQGGILNAASFDRTDAVAAGSLVSIFGSNLANNLTQGSSIPLSINLDNTTVTFNNIPAPLLFVSSGQINAQIPWEVGNATTANVVVTNNGTASAPVSFQLTSAGPGIFANNGVGQAIAYGNSDGAFAAPASFAPNSHPAKIGGDAVIILATGLGAVTPPMQSGNNVTDGQLHSCTTNPQVMVGNVPAQFIYCAMSPQFVGVYQIGIVLAAGTPIGNAVPLQLIQNGITTTSQVTIAVSN